MTARVTARQRGEVDRPLAWGINLKHAAKLVKIFIFQEKTKMKVVESSSHHPKPVNEAE